MGKERILVVDDEEDTLAVSGEEALKKAKRETYELIVLDLMLPGMDGLEVAKALKADNRSKGIPIVMLTAKGEDADVVAGLEIGADDYITKPFSPRVLTARVKAVLRRQSKAPQDDTKVITIHEFEIHPGRRSVLADGQPLDLTFTEFQLLAFLARRPGWVFTRSQIVDAVRGTDYPVTDRSVDVQVVGLRKKLGAYGHYIETVRGVGYRFKEKA
jgi:two-component system phosphate regulon response regulator PhoB